MGGLFGLNRPTWLRLLALLVACIGNLFWGSVSIGTYYTNALRVQYNLTQTQAEMAFPILNAGKVFSAIPAFVFNTYGSVPTFALAIAFTSGGYCLASTTEYYVHLCHENPVIIYVFFFMMGAGSAFFNLANLTVTTTNFGARTRGKVVSFTMTCYSLSPLLTLFVYRRWYADDTIEYDAEQDISGFLRYGAISTGVTGILSLALVRFYERSESEHTPLNPDEEKLLEVNHNKTKHVERKLSEEVKTFCSWPLQMVVWTFVLFYVIYLGFDSNVAVYAKSAEIYNVFDGCFAVLHLTTFASRLTVGFLSDAFLGVVPHMFYVAFSGSLLAVCLLVAVFFPTSEATLYALSATVGCAGGAFRLLIVTVLTKEYGEHNFAKYWGITYSLGALGLTAWLAVFSWLYQSAIQEPGAVDCFGGACLKWINLASSLMITVATMFCLVVGMLKKY